MKKLAIILGMTFIASSYASDACYRSCDSEANQIGLKCQKERQICMRSSTFEDRQMCMDDFQSCTQVGKSRYEACYAECDQDQE